MSYSTAHAKLFCTTHFPKAFPLYGLNPKYPIQPEKSRTLLHSRGRVQRDPGRTSVRSSHSSAEHPRKSCHLTETPAPAAVHHYPAPNLSHTQSQSSAPVQLAPPMWLRTLLRPLALVPSAWKAFFQVARGLLRPFFKAPPQGLTIRPLLITHSYSFSLYLFI